MRLRFRLNNTTVVKASGLISNSVALAANVYLLGTGLHNSVTSRRQERISNSLQTTAELASSIAGLTKVITDNISIYNVQDD